MIEKTDAELGLEPGNQNFCYAYYHVDFKKLRQDIIREVFRDLTGKWNRHFVVYPISPCDDIQLLFSRYYFILYEVESPLRLRYDRFTTKYNEKVERLSLEDFIDLDDKIKFNTEEYSLYSCLAEGQHQVRRRF